MEPFPQPTSSFARCLVADPQLAATCERVAKELREAAQADIEAIERSERLTAKDFSITINARTEDMFTDG